MCNLYQSNLKYFFGQYNIIAKIYPLAFWKYLGFIEEIDYDRQTIYLEKITTHISTNEDIFAIKENKKIKIRIKKIKYHDFHIDTALRGMIIELKLKKNNDFEELKMLTKIYVYVQCSK